MVRRKTLAFMRQPPQQERCCPAQTSMQVPLGSGFYPERIANGNCQDSLRNSFARIVVDSGRVTTNLCHLFADFLFLLSGRTMRMPPLKVFLPVKDLSCSF